ncbi:MAG: hypothetical protein ACREOW_11815 [Thermodesulfobacteriota bacterium]
MLNAILYGKKRGLGQEVRSLIEGFEGAEDLLTASVFERLSYLPDEKLWAILSSPKIWQSLAINITPQTLSSFSFWPKWKLKRNLKGVEPERVEPDCSVEYENIAIIIEAKRYDDIEQQYAKQLGKESIAYWETPNSKPVMLLAVGGLVNYSDKEITKILEGINNYLLSQLGRAPSFYFTAISWATLFKVIENQIISRHEKRILDDIREAMLLHGIGIRDPVWLNDLRKLQLALSITMFQDNSTQTFVTPVVPCITTEDWWSKIKDFLISHDLHIIFIGDLK